MKSGGSSSSTSVRRSSARVPAQSPVAQNCSLNTRPVCPTALCERSYRGCGRTKRVVGEDVPAATLEGQLFLDVGVAVLGFGEDVQQVLLPRYPEEVVYLVRGVDSFA